MCCSIDYDENARKMLYVLEYVDTSRSKCNGIQKYKISLTELYDKNIMEEKAQGMVKRVEKEQAGRKRNEHQKSGTKRS